MAKFALTINGENVTKSQKTLELWSKLVGTRNPGAQTPVMAIEHILTENPGYIETVKATYSGSDTLEVWVTEEGKTSPEFVGGNTFAGFVERMQIASRAKFWMGNIPSAEKKESKSADKGELEV